MRKVHFNFVLYLPNSGGSGEVWHCRTGARKENLELEGCSSCGNGTPGHAGLLHVGGSCCAKIHCASLSCPAAFPVGAPQSFKPRKGNSSSKWWFFLWLLWFFSVLVVCFFFFLLFAWECFHFLLYNQTNTNQRKAFCTGILVLILVLSLFCIPWTTNSTDKTTMGGEPSRMCLPPQSSSVHGYKRILCGQNLMGIEELCWDC